MPQYVTRDQIEQVSLNTAIPFIDSIPCNRGCVYHQNGTGIFILRSNNNNCFSRYEVEFTGNVAITEGGTVGPVATAIIVNGEVAEESRSIFTPAAVDTYGNVTSRTVVEVPKGCCFNVAVEYVSGAVNDPAAVPTPVINVVDGSLSITKIA